MTREKHSCSAWNGQQCKAQKSLTACVFKIEQGSFLKGPDKVVVHLCPKHFDLNLPHKKKTKAEAQ